MLQRPDTGLAVVRQSQVLSYGTSFCFWSAGDLVCSSLLFFSLACGRLPSLRFWSASGRLPSLRASGWSCAGLLLCSFLIGVWQASFSALLVGLWQASFSARLWLILCRLTSLLICFIGVWQASFSALQIGLWQASFSAHLWLILCRLTSLLILLVLLQVSFSALLVDFMQAYFSARGSPKSGCQATVSLRNLLFLLKESFSSFGSRPGVI